MNRLSPYAGRALINRELQSKNSADASCSNAIMDATTAIID